MKLRERLLDRDTIWYTAWGLLPLALVVNVLLGYEFESALRWQERGEFAVNVGDWEGAAHWYARAAEASPRSPMLAYNAGVAWRNAGDLDQARYWNGMALLADRRFEPALVQKRELEQLRRQGGESSGAGMVQPMHQPY